MQTAKLFTAIFAITIMAAACNKKDKTTPGNNYLINGVSDLTLSADTTTLPISVASLDNNVHDSVKLDLSGLPEGLTAFTNQESGRAPATASLNFINYYCSPGTYSVTLTARSGNNSKSYPFSITVPSLNGVRVNGITTYTLPFRNSNYISVPTFSKDAKRFTLFLVPNNSFPSTNGTYTYKIVDINSKPDFEIADDEVSLQFAAPGNGTMYPVPGTKILKLTINNDFVQVDCPHVTVSDTSGNVAELSFSAFYQGY